MIIKVISEKYIKSENFSKLKEITDELIAETRKEKGCIEYTFNQNIQDETNFIFIEAWQSREDLDNHTKTEHFQRLVPQITELCYKDGSLSLFTEF